MNVIPNKKLSHIPPITMDIDSLEDLPYIPSKPLPAKNFAFLIVGQPGSGKTTLWNSLLLSHPTKKKPHTPKLIDDSVRDLTKSKILCKTILNRRHCTQNNDEEGKAGLSIMITSQKYNMIPLALRLNMSQVIVFRTENQKELKSIKEELMGDLTKEQQDELLKIAWGNSKHDFLYIDAFKPKHERYYRNFDRIEIPK